MTTDAAQLRARVEQVRAHPTDASAWSSLTESLLDHDPCAAFALIDEAPRHGLPLATARALREALGGVPISKSGRAFSDRSGDRRVQRRPGASADALIPCGDRWELFRGGAYAPTASLPLSPNEHPASWLDDTTVVVAADAQVDRWDVEAGTLQRRLTLPDPITALLGCGRDAKGWFFAATRRRDQSGQDLYACDIERGAIELLPNLFIDLDREAARWRQGLICCHGGTQSSEVRFVVAPEQRWLLKNTHEDPARVVVEGDDDAVFSLDRRGMLLKWEGKRPSVTGMHRLPPQSLPPRGASVAVSLSPKHVALLMTGSHRRRPLPLQQIDLNTNAVATFEGMNAPPTTISSRLGLAVVGDEAGWYWWDTRHGALPEAWRWPAALATAEELKAFPGLSAGARDAIGRYNTAFCGALPDELRSLQSRLRVSPPGTLERLSTRECFQSIDISDR